MKSAQRGRRSSSPEVGDVTVRGFWLRVGERDYFLAYADFPWFRDATPAELADVQLHIPDHLQWPTLDVDLHLASLKDPSSYPLVARVQPRALRVSEPTPTARRAKPAKRR